MTITQNQLHLARRLAHEVPDIDQGLPFWARRTNPVVRRQLGAYWRVFPPQIDPIVKWYAIQSVVVLLTIPYPILFVIILTFLLAALTMLPFAFYIYVRALGQIIAESTQAMVSELKNDTLTLLRTTPMSTTEIVLSKIAASVWRRVDELDQVLSFALALGMPTIVMFYLTYWPPNEDPLVAQVLTVIMFASSLIRLPLEMVMVATLGAMMGTAVRVRSAAFLGAATIVFFYFLLINLARLLTLSWPVQLVVDSILPVVLPVLISLIALKITLHLIMRD